MKFLISFILIIASFPALCQDSLINRTLQPVEMKEDLAEYVHLLSETHPGLFRYQSEAEFNSSLSSIETQIEDPQPFYTFYKQLADLTAQIKCAHTSIYPKEDIMSYVSNSCRLFPFFMYPINNELYVLFNGTKDDVIKPGFKLISVNGRPVSEIAETIKSHYSMDGNPVSVPRRYLQGGYFSLYYYLFVEQPDEYVLVFNDLNGGTIRFATKGKPYSQIDKAYFSNPVNKEMLSFYNKRLKPWDFKIVEEVPSTAQIHFTGFGGKGMDTEKDAQKAMQDFMNKAMKKIRQKKISNLIIELRGNSGGWDIQGKELFSYFLSTDESVLYYQNQFAITINSRYLQYSDISKEDMERARPYLILQDDGTYKLDPKGNTTLLPQEPKENRFEGNVYILIDEQCSSSCAEFAAAAKSHKIGVLVGSEAGGAYEGGNGGSFINHTLPNTGIYINSPLVKYEMAVDPVDVQGRGTIPDHVVGFTLEDILVGRDAQKEFVYDLIRSSWK